MSNNNNNTNSNNDIKYNKYTWNTIYKSFKDNIDLPELLDTKTNILNFINDINQDIYFKYNFPNNFKTFILSTINTICTKLNITNKTDIINTIEALEGFITKTCYNQLLLYSKAESSDNIFEHNTQLYNFITLNNLSILSIDDIEIINNFPIYTQYLNNINTLKSPRDKLYNIVNLCKLISQTISNILNDSTGADIFLPTLIYIILKNNITNPFTNYNYIKNFRYDNDIYGEIDYYFSSFESAILFIKDINTNTSNLDIDKQELEHKLKHRQLQLKYNKIIEDNNFIKYESIKQELSFKDKSYKDLKITDINDLINEYQLLLKYLKINSKIINNTLK